MVSKPKGEGEEEPEEREIRQQSQFNEWEQQGH